MIDFLIVGGGIAGLSAGARLSQHGLVTVLEAEDAPGYHTSGRSAALFEQNYGPPSVVALSKASAEYLSTENGGYLTPRGLMLLGTSDQAAVFDADLIDLDMRAISVDEAIACVPVLRAETIAYAGRSDKAQDVDTDRLMQDFARIIRKNGGAVLTKRPVTQIHKGRHWTVEAQGSFTAHVLVNAAGAWADQIAGLAGIAPVGITPYRRSIARIPAPGGHDVQEWPMMFGAGSAWYAKPDAGKLLVSPFEAEVVEPHDAYADDFVLAQGLARYEAMVTEPVTRVENNWAGLRSFAPDGTLVLGPDPRDRSFVWCAGQGGYGFQTAPAASRLVADLVCGSTPALDPDIVACVSANRLTG